MVEKDVIVISRLVDSVVIQEVDGATAENAQAVVKQIS